jgi:hypothetical protein
MGDRLEPQTACSVVGPKADRVAAELIAEKIVGDLQGSNWRLIKLPPELALGLLVLARLYAERWMNSIVPDIEVFFEGSVQSG